ncbi:hypothetical protein PHAVU_006G204650 [Phaseolus vulgaris]
MRRTGMREEKREKEVLPLDALINILKRVPVKSLIRFRCVSKEWLNLLQTNIKSLIRFRCVSKEWLNLLQTNIFFTKQQLQHSTCNAVLLLQRIHRQPSPLFFSVCLFGSHYNLIHQSHVFHAFPDAKILDSCNGLLCLRNNTVFSIINPATRQIRQVPTTTLLPFHYVGFGSVLSPTITRSSESPRASPPMTTRLLFSTTLGLIEPRSIR